MRLIKPDIRSQICRRLIKFNTFKVSLPNEETSEIGSKYFVGCYAPCIKGWYYAVTNIGVEILVYMKVFISVKAVFILEGIQRSTLIIKKTNKEMKTDILMKLSKNLLIIASSLRTRYKILKNYVCTLALTQPLPPCSRTSPYWWNLKE